MMVGVGSWLVVARPGPMTWGLYWYLVGWRSPLLAYDFVTFPGSDPFSNIAWLCGDAIAAAGVPGLLVFALRFPYDRVGG
jgi:hypothetical protein